MWISIHAYLGVMASLFCLIFSILNILTTYSVLSNKTRYILHFVFVVFLNLVVFKVFTFVTDTHLGRTTNPYGFLVYIAEFETIFIPSMPPLKPLVDKLIFIQEQIWEGLAYIGVTSLFGIFLFGIISIKESIQKRKIIFFNQNIENRNLQVFIVTALIFLFFSMGFPFRLGFKKIGDVLPVLKEFRALGRFAWVFFYIISVSSVCFLYDYFGDVFKHKIQIRNYLMVIFAFIFIAEGLFYHIENKKLLGNEINYFDSKQLPSAYKLALSNIYVDKYQAIIPIPFFNKGSENFEIIGTDRSLFNACIFSYHTGLPMMANYLARTSISEGKKMSGVISPSFIDKEIKNDIKSNKPFLLLKTNGSLSRFEQEIINKGKKICSEGDFELYEISYEDFFKNDRKDFISNIQKRLNSFSMKHNLLVSKSNELAYYNSFDENKSQISYFGNGSLSGNKDVDSVLCNISASTFDTNKTYSVKLWMYNNGSNYGQDVLNCLIKIKGIDKEGTTRIIESFKPMFCKVVDGNWSMVEIDFKRSPTDTQMQIVLTKDTDNRVSQYFIDELLITENNTETLRSDTITNTILFNNIKVVND
jgi:hypothetical protein